MMEARVFSIGHSTRRLDEFLALLKEHGVQTVADVRTAPGSRRHPHFAKEALARALDRAGLRYVHLPALGGLRRPAPDSPNTAWQNASFRGFADYMATPAFEAGLAQLLELARQAPVAMLCAEAVPWRCHRSLIADALLARGVQVQHILGPGATRPHSLTPFARVEGQRLTYPASLLDSPTAHGGERPPVSHPGEGMVDPTQLISIFGALLILIAYAGGQMGWLPVSRRPYSLVNLAGALLLGYVALVDNQLGFLLLEGSWVVISLVALARPRRTD